MTARLFYRDDMRILLAQQLGDTEQGIYRIIVCCLWKPVESSSLEPKFVRRSLSGAEANGPHIRCDCVHILRLYVAIHSGGHGHVMQDRALQLFDAPVAPNEHAGSQVVTVLSTFAIYAMTDVALPVRSFPVKHTVACALLYPVGTGRVAADGRMCSLNILSGGVTSLSSSACAVSALGAVRNIAHAAASAKERAATSGLPELFALDRNALISENNAVVGANRRSGLLQNDHSWLAGLTPWHMRLGQAEHCVQHAQERIEDQCWQIEHSHPPP